MEQNNKYYAFISYKREDAQWAAWLQHKLEHYKLPANLNGRTDLPREVRPVFRDTSELNPGNLPQQIHDALEASQYLIVICSPRSAKSEWVNKEIETFIAMGKRERIIPFIVDGRAMSSDPEEECFPPAIRNLPAEQELLGANITEMRRDAAAVKTVAQMFGVRFDTLWGRYEREQKLRRNWIIAAVAVFVLAVIGVAAYIWHQDGHLKEAVSRAAAEKAMQLIDEGDAYTARKVALEALNMAYTPEAESALRQAWMCQSAVLRGHTHVVDKVFFSLDGKCVVSTAPLENNTRIWDVRTGQCLKVMKGTLLSPDLKYKILYSKDTCLLQDAVTGQCLWMKQGIIANFSPDEKIIMITGKDSTVSLYEVPSGKSLITVKTPYVAYYNTISPDGRFVACNGWENKDKNVIEDGHSRRTLAHVNRHIYIYEVESGRLFQTISLGGDINGYRFSPDGRNILLSERLGGSYLFDMSTGKCVQKWSSIGDGFAFSPDGKYIASGGCRWGDNDIYLTDAATGKILRTFHGHTNRVKVVVFSPDGKTIASASEDMTVRLWDLDSATYTLRTVIDKEGLNKDMYVENFYNSPDGKYLATTLNDTTIGIWKANTGELMPFCYSPADINDWFDCAPSFSPDNRHIISACYDSTIRIWDIITGECVKSIREPSKQIDAVAYSPDGKHIAVGALDNPIRIWDVSTGECIQAFGKHVSIASVAYSSDGNRLVVTTYDDSVRIWDVKSGRCLYSMQIGGGMTLGRMTLNVSFFSPDGTRIIQVQDNLMIVFDATTGERLRTLEGHTGYIWRAFFSPDGRYIVSDGDKTIRVWDVSSGICMQKIRRPKGCGVVVFSPDGRYLQFDLNEWDNDGKTTKLSICTYDFPSLQELIDRTREQFKNNPLTPEERRKYYLE